MMLPVRSGHAAVLAALLLVPSVAACADQGTVEISGTESVGRPTNAASTAAGTAATTTTTTTTTTTNPAVDADPPSTSVQPSDDRVTGDDRSFGLSVTTRTDDATWESEFDLASPTRFVLVRQRGGATPAGRVCTELIVDDDRAYVRQATGPSRSDSFQVVGGDDGFEALRDGLPIMIEALSELAGLPVLLSHAGATTYGVDGGSAIVLLAVDDAEAEERDEGDG